MSAPRGTNDDVTGNSSGNKDSGKTPSMKAALESVYGMFRDENGTGVSRDKCKAFLWATGHEVDEKEMLDDIIAKYRKDSSGSAHSEGTATSSGLTKGQFMQFVQDAVAVDYGEGDVEETFLELLLPDTDCITVDRLRLLLEQHGEKMPPGDIDQLITHVDPAGTGVINFEQFREIFQ